MTWKVGQPVVVVPIDDRKRVTATTVEHVYRDGSCRALGRRWRPCGREHAGEGGVKLWSAEERQKRDEVVRMLLARGAEIRERKDLMDRLARAHPPIEVLRAFVERVEAGP